MPLVDGLKVEASDAGERSRSSVKASSPLFRPKNLGLSDAVRGSRSSVNATSPPFRLDDAEAWDGSQGSWSFPEATSPPFRLRKPSDGANRGGRSPVKLVSPPFRATERLSKFLQPSLAIASSPSANANGAARESGGGQPAIRADGPRFLERDHWPTISGDGITREEPTTSDAPAPAIQINSTTVLTHSGGRGCGGGDGVPKSPPAGFHTLARDLTRRAFNGRAEKPPNLVIDERVLGAGGTGRSVGQSEPKPESMASAEDGPAVSQIGTANAGKLRKLVTNDIAASASRDRPLDSSIAGPESAPAVSLPYLPDATDVIQKGRFTVKLKRKANTIPRAAFGRRKFTLESRDSGTPTVLEPAAKSNRATPVSVPGFDRARDSRGRPLAGSWHDSSDGLRCRPWTSPRPLPVMPPTATHRRTKSEVPLHSASKISPRTFDSPTSYYTPSPISTISGSLAGCSINAEVGIASGYVKCEPSSLGFRRAPARRLPNGGGPNGPQATFSPATTVAVGDKTEQIIASSASGRRFTVIRKGSLTPWFEVSTPTPLPSPQVTPPGVQAVTPAGVLPTRRICVETVSSMCAPPRRLSASTPVEGAAPAQAREPASSGAGGSNHGQEFAAPASPPADACGSAARPTSSAPAARPPGPVGAPYPPDDAGSPRAAAAATAPPVPADNSGPPAAGGGRSSSRASSSGSSPMAAESTVHGRRGRKFVITRHEVRATTTKAATTATGAKTAAPPSL